MEIFSVNDEKFRKYGKVWNNIECTKLIKGMEHTPLPEDVIYVPSVEELEAVRKQRHSASVSLADFQSRLVTATETITS